MLRKPKPVFIGPSVAPELLDEALFVPNLEVVDASEHSHVADDGGAVAEMGSDDHAALHVEFAGLPVIVDAVQELQPRRVIAGNLRQLLLDCDPNLERIDADTLSRQAGDEHIRP